MFENNNQNQNPNPYDSEPHYTNPYGQIPDSSENSYERLYSNHEPVKKTSGGKVFMKVVAAVAALAVVSVSSVEMYKLFGENQIATSDTSSSRALIVDSSSEDSSAANGNSEADSSADTQKETTSNTSASTASWINMAAPEGSLTIPQIVEKAKPSAVGVSATFEFETSNSNSSFFGFDFYNYYGGGGQQSQQFTGTGTGIVMSEDGYIITNAHCIYDDESQYKAGKAVSVTVVMGDDNETEYDAQIVGYDLQTDLAVLKIDATGLTPAEFGDSEDLQVGELVVAIGNPLGFELFGTTTCGIVSALNREVTINDKEMTLIQTDAAINSGNSGGPLLNGYGQVIGINSAKMGSTYGSASVEGLGFAIPISDAKEIINDLINYGYVAGRPQLGITGVDVTEAEAQRFNLPRGVYVYGVSESSAAAEAGVRQGDIITAIEGTTVSTMEELNEIKNGYNAGDTVKITIYRAGENIELNLTLQEVKQNN